MFIVNFSTEVCAQIQHLLGLSVATPYIHLNARLYVAYRICELVYFICKYPTINRQIVMWADTTYCVCGRLRRWVINCLFHWRHFLRNSQYLMFIHSFVRSYSFIYRGWVLNQSSASLDRLQCTLAAEQPDRLTQCTLWASDLDLWPFDLILDE